MSDTPTKKFGKYEAISQLGAGAMGVVWRARDPILGRTVAIKTISAALGSDDENKQRFLREAQAAAQLNHPNIITIHDFGQEDEELYMAMELLEGKDLKELISGGRLSLDEKLDIMEQVADGLAYAHGRDVIHRDLKPGNIHVQPNGQVKILDFGLARLGRSDLTKTGVVMGTPNYMSPEQVMGARVDARSDVFSAGAVFYELLTNRKPFDAESVHATLYQVVHRDPPPPRQWDPTLPEALVTIVERAMAKPVDQRYRNAAGLRDALRAFRYGGEPPPLDLDPAALGAGGDPDSTAVTDQDATAIVHGKSGAPGPRSGSFRSPGGRTSGPSSASRISRPGVRPPVRPPASSARSSTSLPRGASSSPDLAAPASPPPPRSTSPALVGAILVLAVVVAFIGYSVLNRQEGSGTTQSSIDALTANLVETQLDLARRVLDDKDYKGAIEQTSRTLKLDARNPEALAIREQAQSALREIDESVKAARDAVARGDSAQASAALERVMARDPRNPIVAELSSQLNSNFAARATAARADMEKAKAAALAKSGASSDPAYGEAEKFAASADSSLKARQFTTATQTFLQARDAYDRARRAIETRDREAARNAGRPVPTAPPVQTPAPTVAATPLPTVVIRPEPQPTQAPVQTPAPTVAPAQTPPPPPPPATPAPEMREFVTAATRITPAPVANAKQPKGFSMSGVAIQEFTGRFAFEVVPSPLVPGSPYRVRVTLRNEGKFDARIDTLVLKLTRNGETSTLPARVVQDNVKAGQSPIVTEVSGVWAAGTTSWSLEVEVVSKKGERFQGGVSMK